VGEDVNFSYCSHLCGFKWLGRLAAVCALSERIMNKGQLTALIVGGAQVERVVLLDALSSGLAARYVVIEAEYCELACQKQRWP
jgi:hypothetical protein